MMDSTEDTYMQYHNTNPNVDINQFLNGVQDFANSLQDETQGLDPALFDIGNGDNQAFHAQQTQPPQSNQPNYSQGQRPAQSQSPALSSYKTGQNTFSAHPYNMGFYDQRTMAHPTFDSHLASRPSASPQSFEHFYPPNMNYNQQYADPRYAAFAAQTQRQTTPTQPFRPQIPSHYMNVSNPSPQPQPHISQVQNVSGMPYTYQQPAQTHRFIDPSATMLSASAHQYQNNPNDPRPAQTPQYFQHTANTLNPRELQTQYGFQVHQLQNIQPNTQRANGVLPQYAHQSVLQFQPQNVATSEVKPTKEPKSRAKKDGKKDGSASDSDDDLEVEAEPPEARPLIISVLKPTDQAGKLLWEVVDAVWSPHNKPASADKIRTAVAFVGEAVRGLRDQWKSQNEQLKKAELPNSDTASQAASLKAAVSAHRDTMERLVARVTQYGHPWILKRLGENHFTLSAQYNFLADRVNADDYDSSLVTAILQLASKFETLDEEQLEKVKWTKVLNRFAKKSTNESKKFAKQIIDNAKANTAKKSEASMQGPSSPTGSASGKTVAPVAGVKRAREGSDPIQQVKKAAVKPASKPLSLQIAEARKAKEKEKAAAAAAVTVKDVKADKGATNGTSSVPARPKVAVAAAPKPSPFASLMSASKRPGTSNAERAAKDKVDTAKKPETNTVTVKKDSQTKTDSPPTRSAATAQPASSFLGFLADMEKPKEAPTPKPEEIPNETADARAKRLHKESRRRLRVSWKNENELVETRIFEHDPDEDTGHEDSMMRDAGDTTKEGEMLKQKINIDEIDEDEDEIEYSPPSDVDFDALGAEIIEQNFFKFGGSRKPESTSSDAQDKHEEGNLMTTYTSRDQPDSPKEPPEDGDDDDDFSPPLDFGEPSSELVRQREKQILAQRQAYQPQQPQSNGGGGFDLAAVLANMQPQNQTQSWQSLQYGQQPQQAQAAVPQQQPPNALQGLDMSKILAVAQQMQQSQTTYQPPAPVPQQQQTTTVDPNIAALLASFNQQAAAAQAAADASGHGPALPLGQGANPNPWPGAAAGESSHREQQPKGKKGKGQGKGKAPVGPDGLPLNYKTQVCQFWLEGRCTKGDLCTYKHSKD